MQKYIGLVILLLSFFIEACKEPNKPQNNSNENGAIAEINKRLAADTNNADLYFARAQAYLQDTMVKPAINDLLSAIGKAPNNTSYRLALSDVYFNTGNLIYALESAKKAYQLEPENIDIKNKLAKYYLITKGYDNALVLCKESHLLDPNNAEAFFIEGMVYSEQEKVNLAIAAMKKCLEQDPEYTDAHMQIATLYNRSKNPEALRYYNYTLKLDSTNIIALYGKAMYLQQYESKIEAIKIYNNIVSIDPNYANAHYNLGYIYLEQDSVNKALRFFDRAIKVKPTYFEAYYMRGLCYEKSGDYKNAKVDYNQSLTFNENYTLALDGLKRIKNQ